MNDAELREAAKKARNAYFKAWRAKNPDKVKAAQDRHWMKVAAANIKAAEVENNDKKGESK